jgi:Ca2+/Na+ antiporter
MDKKVFRTDLITLFSYSMLVVSYSLFFGALILKFGKLTFSGVVLLILVLPILGYLVFLAKKKVALSESGIEIFGLTGKKFIKWDDVENVSLTPGRKYFLFFSSKDGKVAVVDDSVSNFKGLLEEIQRRIPNKLSENFPQIASSYKRSYTSNAVILIASLILLFILIKDFL